MLGMGSLARKVFGTPNDRKVKSVRPIVAQINALEPEYQALLPVGVERIVVENKCDLARRGPARLVRDGVVRLCLSAVTGAGMGLLHDELLRVGTGVGPRVAVGKAVGIMIVDV